jgi:surfactin synthase thioesterase subunit
VDGNLHFLGRRDEQVKIRGFRIELDEIENVLMTNPGVHAAAVVPRERAGEHELVAFIVSSGTTPEMLAAYLKARLPEYMAPSLFVEVEALPLSDNGKVNRNLLRSRAKLLEQVESREVEPVQTDEERYLRDLWAEVLAVDPAQIGRTSDFFRLGGSSLTGMISALRSDGRYRVNDLFRHRTIKALATAIALPRGGHQPLHPLAPIRAVAEHTLVCFPYAGGDAFNFQPFADAIRELRPQYQVIGVEYERTVDSSIADFASRILSHLNVRPGELSILGHCSGAAPALALAQAAERSGKNPAAVFLCGKLLREEPELQAQINEARGMTADEILRWLAEKTGLAGMEKLTPAMAQVVAENFRWDTVEANRYLIAVQGSETILDAPIIHVLSPDDPVTRNEEHLTSRWSRLSRDKLRHVRLDGGGHYFIATRPHQLARAVVEHIASSGARNGKGEILAEEVSR